MNTWNIISQDDLLELLKRAHAGEDPDMLYAELYANAEHTEVEGPE